MSHRRRKPGSSRNGLDREGKSVGTKSFKMEWPAKLAFALATLAFLAAAQAPANATGLGAANGGSGGPTGNYLFTFYTPGTGVIRLMNPNGCGNGGVGNANCTSETDICAMIYVFDDNEELQICCGCRITPTELRAAIVTSNAPGTIAIVGSSINDPGSSPFSCGNTSNPSCFQGCSPTLPAITGGANNLVGSITHSQTIGAVSSLTEIPFFDQGGGEPVDNAFFVNECAALIGNGSDREGFCECGPTPG